MKGNQFEALDIIQNRKMSSVVGAIEQLMRKNNALWKKATQLKKVTIK
jgi:hypothetical protein